jgi:hypothetical protein
MAVTINASTSSGLITTADTSGVLALQTAGTTAVTIDASQNVGIGTSSPQTPFGGRGLQLGNTSDSRAVLTLQSVNTGQGNIYFSDGTTGGDTYVGFIDYIHSTNYMAFGTGATERVRIDSSGNLLVGATSGGGQRLYVSAANSTTAVISSNNTTNGNAAGISSSLQTGANNTSSYHFYGSTLAVGNWYLYGNGTSSWSSDERLKKNIVTTRDGYLDDVCKLRVVKYQWKNGPQQVELGLIAQEVEQIFPGLVQDDLNQISPDDTTKYKQLKGSVLPMILLKAIQEQQAIIETLKARLDAANL